MAKKTISDIELLHNEIIKRNLTNLVKKKQTDVEDTEYFVEDAPEPQYSVGFISNNKLTME